MSLQVFGRGKAGEIILHDQRPDGTAILLVCQEFAGPGRQSAVTQPNDEVGVGIASSTDGGIFPMLDETGMARRKFRLHLDTTAMPEGPMRFGMERFARRALQAVDDGYREVLLTMDNADEWGWHEPPEADRPGAGYRTAESTGVPVPGPATGGAAGGQASGRGTRRTS